MTSTPLVTIITPCYNYGKFLGEALESLLHQTYLNWECIIVNDGSEDNTEEVALKYVAVDSRFKYIKQKNKGLPSARNAALKQSKGEYIQLLDADDLLEADKLSIHVGLFQSHDEYDLIYSSVLLFSNQAVVREFKPFNFSNPAPVSGKDQVILDSLMTDVFFLPGCTIFRRKVFEQVGYFNENLYGLEDWNYWFRAALLGFEFYHDDKIGTKLLARDHDANMSKVYFKMLNARIVARSHIIEFSKELKNTNKWRLSPDYYRKYILRHYIFLNQEMYEYNYHQGNKLTAFKALFKYSYYSKKPLFPIIKILQSLFARIKT